MEQRSAEWFAVKCGKIGAGRVHDITTKTRTGYGASRANVMAEIVCERLTGRFTESFTTASMQWGIDQEAAARDLYSARTGQLIEEVGWVDHPTIADAGCSPDGLVGDDGLIEIKCPNTATALDYVLSRKIPARYQTQMQWQMACSSRAWCDFVSFDPRLPEHLQMLVIRVERDDQCIKELEAEVRDFLVEVEQKVQQLKELEA